LREISSSYERLSASEERPLCKVYSGITLVDKCKIMKATIHFGLEVLTGAKMSTLLFWVKRHVDFKIDTKVSEVHTASIFSLDHRISIFRLEDGSSMFLRSFGLQVYPALLPRRPISTRFLPGQKIVNMWRRVLL
jgi:hypothetical protein